MSVPKIIIREKVLTILLAKDEGNYCAYCPELDIVSEMENPEIVIEDMIEAIKEYSEEYMQNIELYTKSPNRAHHLPYVQTISNCKNDWELRMLMEIKHGFIQL